MVPAATTPNSPRAADIRLADRWFEALDQRRIGAGADSWVAQVLGIHVDEVGTIWIQVTSVDNPYTTIVLHVSASTTVERVTVALEEREASDSRPEIIDLATVA
jgi:hypothetical protein